MTAMTLEKAIAEVKYWHERGRYWPGEPATVAEVIITAAASGDLIPLADHRLAVALMVLKAKDAVIAADSAFEGAYGSCERILALADTDALAEVQALREYFNAFEAFNGGGITEAMVARVNEARAALPPEAAT